MGRIGKGTAACAAAPALLLGIPDAALAYAQGAGGRAGAVRVVQSRGYRGRVPAGWPVYNLAADPSRCVLFSRHAVYLGQPGANQRCPVHAFGRTQALLIQPFSAPASLLSASL